MTKAIGSGLILPVRVGKYIDKFIQKVHKWYCETTN